VTEDDRDSEGEAVEMSDDEEANDVTVNTTAAEKKFVGEVYSYLFFFVCTDLHVIVATSVVRSRR
jgi:hypothetical protein